MNCLDGGLMMRRADSSKRSHVCGRCGRPVGSTPAETEEAKRVILERLDALWSRYEMSSRLVPEDENKEAEIEAQIKIGNGAELSHVLARVRMWVWRRPRIPMCLEFKLSWRGRRCSRRLCRSTSVIQIIQTP